MIRIEPIFKGVKNLQKDLAAETKRQRKALDTAVRVAGYRAMRKLKKEIRRGAPGGQKFKGLSYLARRSKAGTEGRWDFRRLRPDKPLARLAIAVRYYVPRRSPIEMHIGWAGPDVSKSWKRIARLHQQGFYTDMDEYNRAMFARLASKLSKRAAGRKYLFLKKTTRRFKVPKRPIIEPFWDAHRREIMREIRLNYTKKLKGKRI